jgi:hypothetical protein
MSSATASAEFVTQTRSLSRDEWLGGLRFSFLVAVFHHALLRRTMQNVRRAGMGVQRQLMALSRLTQAPTHCPDSRFDAVMANHSQFWHDYNAYDADLITSILGSNFIEDNPHFQAIVKLVVSTAVMRKWFVTHFGLGLLEAVFEADLVREEAGALLNEQLRDLEAVSDIIARSDGSGAWTGAESDNKLNGIRFDTLILGFYYGSLDPTRLAGSSVAHPSFGT